jgi:hypothetical protein
LILITQTSGGGHDVLHLAYGIAEVEVHDLTLFGIENLIEMIALERNRQA